MNKHNVKWHGRDVEIKEECFSDVERSFYSVEVKIDKLKLFAYARSLDECIAKLDDQVKEISSGETVKFAAIELGIAQSVLKKAEEDQKTAQWLIKTFGIK